jgi:hypothetical protein
MFIEVARERNANYIFKLRIFFAPAEEQFLRPLKEFHEFSIRRKGYAVLRLRLGAGFAAVTFAAGFFFFGYSRHGFAAAVLTRLLRITRE